jgi:hypothetical protein
MFFCDVAPCIVLWVDSRVRVEVFAAIFRVDLAGESIRLCRVDTLVSIYRDRRYQNQHKHNLKTQIWHFPFTLIKWLLTYALALVPERDFAAHVNTGYKVVFEAASEENALLAVSKVKLKYTLVQALWPCTGRSVKCTLVQALRLCTGLTLKCTLVQALRLCAGRTVKCTFVQALRLCTGRTVKGTLVQARKLSPPPGFDPRTVQLYRLSYTVLLLHCRWILYV